MIQHGSSKPFCNFFPLLPIARLLKQIHGQGSSLIWWRKESDNSNFKLALTVAFLLLLNRCKSRIYNNRARQLIVFGQDHFWNDYHRRLFWAPGRIWEPFKARSIAKATSQLVLIISKSITNPYFVNRICHACDFPSFCHKTRWSYVQYSTTSTTVFVYQ